MSKAEFVTVTTRPPVAFISIHREPVNICNRQVWSELLSALQHCESQPGLRAAVFQSSLSRDVFSAGNDINELYAPHTSREQFTAFWHVQTTFLSHLYRSRLFTVAMIRGASPAGGCILALCCDSRVQSIEGNPTIGLNEVALGIPVPKYWSHIFSETVGSRALAEDLLSKGKLIPCQEALRIGLIHAAVPKDQLQVTVDAELKQRLALPDFGRQTTKQHFRQQMSEKWEAEWAEEAAKSWQSLNEPGIIKVLGKVLERLKAGANKNAKL